MVSGVKPAPGAAIVGAVESPMIVPLFTKVGYGGSVPLQSETSSVPLFVNDMLAGSVPVPASCSVPLFTSEPLPVMLPVRTASSCPRAA